MRTALATQQQRASASELYLDLLKGVLTDTIFTEEPDRNRQSGPEFLVGFTDHYIRGRAISMLPRARLENLQKCAEDVLQNDIPGDLIETGVWRGGATIFMRGILKAFGVHDRVVWVADSFEGLPKPDSQKFPLEVDTYEGKMMKDVFHHFAAQLDEVKANFERFGMLDDQVRFLKGWFKDTLPAAPIERLAIMRLDGDFYESTMDALISLYDKVSGGGYVIVDDYGEDSWTYCRTAVEDFRKQRGITDPIVPVDSACHFWKKSHV